MNLASTRPPPPTPDLGPGAVSSLHAMGFHPADPVMAVEEASAMSSTAPTLAPKIN